MESQGSLYKAGTEKGLRKATSKDGSMARESVLFKSATLEANSRQQSGPKQGPGNPGAAKAPNRGHDLTPGVETYPMSKNRTHEESSDVIKNMSPIGYSLNTIRESTFSSHAHAAIRREQR